MIDMKSSNRIKIMLEKNKHFRNQQKKKNNEIKKGQKFSKKRRVRRKNKIKYKKFKLLFLWGFKCFIDGSVNFFFSSFMCC